MSEHLATLIVYIHWLSFTDGIKTIFLHRIYKSLHDLASDLLSQPYLQIFPPCPIPTIIWTLAKPDNFQCLTYDLHFLLLFPYLTIFLH